MITNHCGDAAAQKINDGNFNDKVILNSRIPSTCTQSWRLQKKLKFFLKTRSCM